MTVFRALRISACAIALLAVRASAQVVSQGQEVRPVSPIDDLLRQSQNAFNDLQYARADSFATLVLALQRINASQRTRALMLRAAAYYPEEAGTQKRALALETLQQVVRTNIDASIPQELAWAGLDSLLAEAKRSTFGAAIGADAEQVIVGPAGMAQVRVRANKPASFRLFVVSPGSDTPLVVGTSDSVNAGTVRFFTMRDGRPIFATGDYEIVAIAAELDGKDTSIVRAVARITAPELKIETVPVVIDSSRFVTEHSSAYGWRGIIVGALTSGVVYGLSSVLRGDASFKPTIPADSKGIAAAGAMGVAVIAASYLDPGRTIPSAVSTNQRYRENFAKSIRDAAATNAERLAKYRTIIVLQAGTR